MSDRSIRLRTVPLLSPRRLQIMKLAASGLTNQQIAAQLWLSTNTVKTHLAHAFKILGARDRGHAVAICLVLGIIETRELRPFAPVSVPAPAVRRSA